MMETFIDFIRKQFEENGYSVLETIHNDVLFLKNKEHEDYWLIALSLECYQNQDNLFHEIQSSLLEDYPLAVKNSSLLILYDTKTGLLESNELIEVENDPLYFKKYVLVYTENSYKELKDILGGVSVSDLAMNNAMFKRMMNEEVLGPATLLYSIMHKLPFIQLKQATVDKGNQTIFYSAGSNAKELIPFLDNISDEEIDISQAVDNLLEIKNNGEVDN